MCVVTELKIWIPQLLKRIFKKSVQLQQLTYKDSFYQQKHQSPRTIFLTKLFQKEDFELIANIKLDSKVNCVSP